MTEQRLGPEARELIEQALREEESVDPGELARIRRRVLAVSVGVGALGSAGKTLALTGTSGTVGAASIVKAALLGASAAAVAVGLSSVFGLHEAPSAPARAPQRAHGHATAVTPIERAALEPSAPPAQNAASALSAAPASRAVSVTPTSRAMPELSAPGTVALKHESTLAPAATPHDTAPSPSPSSDSSLLKEIALLEQVQVALRAGNGARALSLLDQKSPDPASGQLGSERLAAEVFAACQAGDRERARRAARRFLQAYPATPASARVQASCAGQEAER